VSCFVFLIEKNFSNDAFPSSGILDSRFAFLWVLEMTTTATPAIPAKIAALIIPGVS